MKVRLLQRMAGPDGNFAPGTVLDLPDAEAQQLIRGRSAIAVDLPPIETTALASEAELAISPQPKRRRGKPNVRES